MNEFLTTSLNSVAAAVALGSGVAGSTSEEEAALETGATSLRGEGACGAASTAGFVSRPWGTSSTSTPSFSNLASKSSAAYNKTDARHAKARAANLLPINRLPPRNGVSSMRSQRLSAKAAARQAVVRAEVGSTSCKPCASCRRASCRFRPATCARNKKSRTSAVPSRCKERKASLTPSTVTRRVANLERRTTTSRTSSHESVRGTAIKQRASSSTSPSISVRESGGSNKSSNASVRPTMCKPTIRAASTADLLTVPAVNNRTTLGLMSDKFVNHSWAFGK
mmetsp:Transcript_60228/g.168117  ORF Transcript_60228/g.168117 Transcript_60228/m.168117 type:complete len:281 (+) Transcript_60228:693-1535(+)